jgi:peptidyl-prolyl cis-trans isomerase B (cyclophilin B)
MAHAGKNTGGSQFFIVHTRQATSHLDGLHTCFGMIQSGDEIIDKIKQGDKFSIEIL